MSSAEKIYPECQDEKKKIAVFPLTQPTLFQKPESAIFYQYKCKIRKKTTYPQQHTCIFIKLLTRPCSFLNRKIKKSFSYLLSKFFSMSVETQLLFFFFFLRLSIEQNCANCGEKIAIWVSVYFKCIMYIMQG